jgi:hypothetical protein
LICLENQQIFISGHKEIAFLFRDTDEDTSSDRDIHKDYGVISHPRPLQDGTRVYIPGCKGELVSKPFCLVKPVHRE